MPWRCFPDVQDVFGVLAKRSAPQGQAAAASPKSQGKESSPYVGVCRSRSEATPWKAQIWHDGRTHFLGSYVDEEDAARAYDAGARRLRGENTKGLNFPKPAASPKAAAGPRSSRYAGVTLKAGRWQAQIWHEGKQHHLGTFTEVTLNPDPAAAFLFCVAHTLVCCRRSRRPARSTPRRGG